ncbi:MAG: arginase family protein [Solirubrobacteraceae bacterium]
MSPASLALRPASLVGLRCRISEPASYARGIEPLVDALAGRLDTAPRMIGTPPDGPPLGRPYAQDLRAARGCLLEAGGQVDDALAAGRLPVLVHGDCSICLGTLPALARREPGVKVLWLDAHGDFNTPDTSPSGWLGGMSLAGACGRWDPGLGLPPFPAERVVLCGVRELDPGERELLERSSATVIGASLETLVYLANALDGAPVYVHLDPDVLDPAVFPAQFPADGGLSADKLYDLLEAVAGSCRVVGLEVAAFHAPDDAAERSRCADLLAGAVEPLLADASHGH